VGTTIFTLLKAVRHAHIEYFDRLLQPYGVRVGQQFILELLWQTREDLSIGEIASRLGIEAPTVTRTIQRMIGQGLVEKYPHPTDARLVLVRLTAHGSALGNVLPEVLAQAQSRLLTGISEVEKAFLVRLFRQMLQNAGEEPPM